MHSQPIGSRCPWCNTPLTHDRDTEGDEALVPVEGDASVCWHCARVCIFTSDLSLRKPTDEEWKELVPDEMISLAVHHAKTHGPRNPHD